MKEFAQMLLLIVLCCCGLSANAKNYGWLVLVEDSQGVLQLHPDSIITDDYGYTNVWIKATFKKPSRDVKTIKALYLVDCSERNFALSHSIFTNAKGKVIDEVKIHPLAVTFTDPGTSGGNATIVRAVCENFAQDNF